MIIGVLSDTHNNCELMMKAVRILTDDFCIDSLIHLGDDWEDKEYLERLGYQVKGVPGLWCSAYRSGYVPKVGISTFNNTQIVYVHDIQALTEIPLKTALLLSGHTHHFHIELRQGIPHMNPGHLKSPINRGREASFGVVQLDKKSMSLSVYNLQRQLQLNRTFSLRHEYGKATDEGVK